MPPYNLSAAAELQKTPTPDFGLSAWQRRVWDLRPDDDA
jgi:hypothetical protein